MEEEYIIEVDCSNCKERIDKLIAGELEDVSRSRIQKLLCEGYVYVNNIQCTNSHEKVKCGDIIRVCVPVAKDVDILPENIDLDIVYEDDDIIIINKPQGMVVHPSAGHYSGTLVNALMYHFGDNLSGINGELRPGIVHRIDMDTSGILVICKNDKAHNYLSGLFGVHDINRIYYCLCNGILKEECVVDAPIGRHKTDRKKMSVNRENGKRAVTHFKPIIVYDNKYTLVECRLETGRTHQIRVHMASINHPLVGDKIYGNVKSGIKADGQLLHAAVLGFVHPATNEYIEFRSALPENFYNICSKLGNNDKLNELMEYLNHRVCK